MHVGVGKRWGWAGLKGHYACRGREAMGMGWLKEIIVHVVGMMLVAIWNRFSGVLSFMSC